MNMIMYRSWPIHLCCGHPRLLYWLIIVTLLHTSLATGQTDTDILPPPLRGAPSTKSIVVHIEFRNGAATGYRANVVVGHAPGRFGNPPLFGIDVFDFRGNAIEHFDIWNPLWRFVRDENGSERLIIQTETTGTIIFPFMPDYGTMHVTDLEQGQETISVDLISPIREFCKENLQDPDCRPDLDSDGDVDRDDLSILLRDLGKSVTQSACGPRCDLNGDGQITNLDAHELIQLCSRPQCATQ